MVTILKQTILICVRVGFLFILLDDNVIRDMTGFIVGFVFGNLFLPKNGSTLMKLVNPNESLVALKFFFTQTKSSVKTPCFLIVIT